jgi:hypothetical protein
MTSVVRVVRLFEALPAPTRGISWMAFATFFYAATSTDRRIQKALKPRN